MTEKQKPARVPRYYDDDGWYLVVLPDSDGYRLVWTDGDDEGARLGDGDSDPESEVSVAERAVKAYAKGSGLDLFRECCFDSERHAKAALRAANVALHAAKAKRPMPEWATIAIANGFTPPNGWKP